MRLWQWIRKSLVVQCPGTGRIVRLKKIGYLLFPLTGLIALAWYCLRVLPKPSRAAYPCQRIAAPVASTFLAWIVGVGCSIVFFKKARKFIRQSRFIVAGLCGAAAVVAIFITSLHTATPTRSEPTMVTALPALPIGTAKGIMPGRVTWAYDPAATNENCGQTDGDYWWMDKNTNQTAVDKMVSQSIQQLTNTKTDSAAWVALFKYFNKQRNGRDNTGYTKGEKIVIKVNFCSAFGMSKSSYTKQPYAGQGDYRDMTDASPQIICAFLKQLTTVVGVAQADISLGDPNKPFFDQFYNMIQPKYPNVKYVDRWGTNGRTLSTQTATEVISYSDHAINYANLGSYPRQQSDKLPQCFVDAAYMINIGCMKGHECAGVTMCAKNHFGSQSRQSDWSADQGWAWHLHYALPQVRPGYGLYRNLVDFLGHKDLGGKTVLSVLDALWSGYTSTPTKPNKWKSQPFNNDYPSSILMSQDPLAIESVGLDFLKEEYKSGNHSGDSCHPNEFVGVDDYLYQAADPANWPKTVEGQNFVGYDPENDGTFLKSLGAFDRWNNPTDKKYSRNIDPVNGKGVELWKVTATPVRSIDNSVARVNNTMVGAAKVFTLNGKLVRSSADGAGANRHAAQGIYLVRRNNLPAEKAAAPVK
jgi:hypothetical protein